MEFEVAARFLQPYVDDSIASFQASFNGDNGLDRRPPANKRIRVVLMGEVHRGEEPNGKFFVGA